MTFINAYRLPAFVFLFLLVIIAICVKGAIGHKTVIINGSNVSFTKSGQGRYAALSYDLDITDKVTHKKYNKTYRTFCISNMFFDLDELKQSKQVYIQLPSSQLNKVSEANYYSVTNKPASIVGMLFRMLSYLVSNMPYIFLIPIVVSGGFFRAEFSKEYQYVSNLHRLSIKASFYIIIIFSIITAVY